MATSLESSGAIAAGAFESAGATGGGGLINVAAGPAGVKDAVSALVFDPYVAPQDSAWFTAADAAVVVGSGGAPPPPPVPEPASCVLMGCGLAALSLIRRSA